MPKEEWKTKANEAILLLEEAGFLMAEKALGEKKLIGPAIIFLFKPKQQMNLDLLKFISILKIQLFKLRQFCQQAQTYPIRNVLAHYFTAKNL